MCTGTYGTYHNMSLLYRQQVKWYLELPPNKLMLKYDQKINQYLIHIQLLDSTHIQKLSQVDQMVQDHLIKYNISKNQEDKLIINELVKYPPDVKGQITNSLVKSSRDEKGEIIPNQPQKLIVRSHRSQYSANNKPQINIVHNVTGKAIDPDSITNQSHHMTILVKLTIVFFNSRISITNRIHKIYLHD